MNKEENDIQNVKLPEEANEDIINKDNIREGIIWSEILNRKY